MQKKAYGFTVVEIVIVIAVIAILATITIASYRHAQIRAENSVRVSDMARIVEALEIYRIKNNAYPTTNPACSNPGDWEYSNLCPNDFLSVLQPYLDGKTMVDPNNSSTSRYRYFRYSAGTSGCDSSKGHFYILEIIGPTTQASIDSSPGWTCPSRNWTTSATKWVTGSFLNP